MNLLAKGNSDATRKSVTREAWIWSAISCGVYGFSCIWSEPAREAWPLLVPVTALFGAAVGALMEWQLDDGDDVERIVVLAEKEFHVRITDWYAIKTIGDLHQVIVTKLSSPDLTQVNSDIQDDEVWERLKALIVQLGLPPERTTKSANIYEEFG